MTDLPLGDWLVTYRDLLPVSIRPSLDDGRYVKAGMLARTHGWTPQQAAHIVANRSYTTAINPPLIALMALENVASTPHHLNPTGRQRHPSGCLVCAPGRTCDHPVTPANVTRPEWVPDRMALLRELRATEGMTEDEREHHMAVLVNHQRGTLLA